MILFTKPDSIQARYARNREKEVSYALIPKDKGKCLFDALEVVEITNNELKMHGVPMVRKGVFKRWQKK